MRKSGGAALRETLMSVPRAVQRTVGLVPGVRAFLRERLTIEQAEAGIREALERRAEHFLRRVRTEVFAAPHSPYRTLFRWAGCEYGDLESSVHREGVEKTLSQLARDGVYLTSDEFKGKRPVARGTLSFRVMPEDMASRDVHFGLVTASSGTMNRPIRSLVTLGWLAQRALVMAVFFKAHGLWDRAHAIYDGILPSGGGVNNVLIYARLGVPVERWFTRPGSVDPWVPRQYYGLMTRAIVSTVSRFGPGPVHLQPIDPADVARIVRWIQRVHHRGQGVCIATAASNAARIARTAVEMGGSLAGTTFITTGEPLTEEKRKVIERAGAVPTPRYAYGGGVNIGLGCADPADVDDHHVNEYLLALLPHPQSLLSEGPPIHPLLCTTLHPAAPRLLINVESGDYATVSRRTCGCALGAVGLTLHVSAVRSFEKLTSEGMNYYSLDLFGLLEKTLPGEFGGGPGDYQLVEEEDHRGQTHLTLRVAPTVGPVDERRLLSRAHEELARGSRGNRMMEDVWRRAGTLRVRREMPYATPRGKVLPLHIPR